ncbi:MAG: methyltransferase domain-containing protein [Oscillospiraceae bacterium]|nr:methyltransferase domain-containing protein [Oscillospiraceae bacterium]
MSDSIWSCPVCGKPLYSAEKSLRCETNHSFDRGRSGYVHLLPSNRQNAKLPGDNPDMVRARRNFLNKGYYAHLLESLSTAAKAYLPENGVLLDAGCGEGYYTKGVRETMAQLGRSAAFYGVDISKTAADLAARSDKQWIMPSAAYSICLCSPNAVTWC